MSLTDTLAVAPIDAPVRVAWEQAVDDAPVSVSVCGDLVAVAGAGGHVWMLDAGRGLVVGDVTLAGGALEVAVAPDARSVAVTGPFGYALWRREDGSTHVVEDGRWSAAAAWAGTDVVAVASGRRAVVLGRDGTRRWATDEAPSTVTDLAWLREGRRLAVAAYGAVRCHERHSAEPVAQFPYVGSHLAIAVPSTGRWICSGNQDASIHIWRTRDASELTMRGYPAKVSRLAFDDTGRWLAADGMQAVTVWDFGGQGPAGTAPRELQAHEAITSFAWRPGSHEHLASGGKEGVVALWRASSGQGATALNPANVLRGDAAVAGLAWCGTDVLVCAYRDGRIRAYRLPSSADV